MSIESLETRSLLAAISVTTPLDVENPSDGVVSLREAIAQAIAASDHDTINFDLGPGAHTINLTAALPVLSTDMDIQGPGADLLTIRRDTGGDYRIFTTSATVAFSGVTITNGSLFGYGTGILNFGALTVSNCTLSGNTAAGIVNYGDATVSNSTFTGNTGDGIFNGQNLAVTSSTLSGNGLGLDNTGYLTLSNSTLSSNTSVGILNRGDGTVSDSTLSGNSGGGITNYNTITVTNSTLSGNTGGGIFNVGTLTITNSTLDGNSATDFGGGIYNVGNATVTNCTLSGNTAYLGGGIFNNGDLSVTSSTISRNSVSAGGGGMISNSALTASNCIIALNGYDDYENLFGGANLDNHNFIGTRDGDPKLGPLADNGGPTQTMALLPGSPCVNAGDPNFTGLDFDQRGPGFDRVVGGRVDIGAYELQVPLSGLLQDLTSRVAATVLDGTLNSGQGTALANPLKNAAIQLAAGQTKQTVQSLTTFVNQINARIKALNPKDADYATKLADLQTLLTEAQSIITPLLAP